MQIRIREPTLEERWTTRAEIFWQPVNSKNGRWYPCYYRNIMHTDPAARRNALNALYIGHITTICRAKYNRERHILTILSPKGDDKA